MAAKKKISQANLYEFKPSKNISETAIMELAEIVRVGVTGRVLELLSDDLKKHFVEVKDGQMGNPENSN